MERMERTEATNGRACLPHVQAVLEQFKVMEFETQENVVGDVTIKPSTRRQMKKDLVAAFKEDFNEAFDPELCETIINDDGMMLIVAQDNEGFITVEDNIKLKNLDYEPLY